ncbi:hypothetical protein EI555_004614 [Monodon monoceros]|uniref:Uncharacterized protein n=1 Tax=Monodon monoceros TaxID=40151 RepID=A0A4U1FRX0_MONMO|nr:hypothetical protein EI555_004614 [Monodon monoceros]
MQEGKRPTDFVPCSPIVLSQSGLGFGEGAGIWISFEYPCCSPHLPDPLPCLAAPTPQCEEIKITVQKHRQSLRHSKEELNRLNQAIQWLTVEVDGTKSQVRGGSGGSGVVMVEGH